MTIKSNKRTTKPPKKYQTYMLRTCNSNYTSSKGFKYPKKGFVYAPDWDAEPVCGNGLHGLLKGEGDPCYLGKDPNAIWQVLMVDKREVVGLDDKVKVPRAWVILSGTKEQAVAKMQELGCSLCVYGVVTAGDKGTATAGKRGKATAGDWGTATAGDNGTATAGKWGTATAGDCGTSTAGDCGTATVGNEGTATAGYKGTATAGSSGTATAGDNGTATAGYRGTATAGYRGTATAGNYGTATAGNDGTAIVGSNGTASAGVGGIIQLRYMDSKSKYRIATGYIGENGLLPNTRYKVDNKGKLSIV